MSGAEVIGLVSGIIAIVDAITKITSAVQDATHLPSAFRDVAQRMPLLKDTLIAAREGLPGEVNKDSYAALEQVFKRCKEKNEALEKILRAVVVEPNASKRERYRAAVRTLAKGRHLDELMDGIIADMQLITSNYSIKSATRARVESLVWEMQSITTDSPKGQPSVSIVNHRTGTQAIHTGIGDQNFNTGSVSQFNGNFAGPFHFSLPPSR